MKKGNDRCRTRYRSVAQALREEIRAGKYAPGKAFPSLTALMRRFGVSRPTAVRAVAELKRAGDLDAEHGSGTTVRSRSLGLVLLSESPLFQSFCEEFAARCQRGGYALMLGMVAKGTPGERAREAREIAERFAAQSVQGVLFQPIGRVADARRRNEDVSSFLRGRGIPLVLLDGDIVPVPERSGFDTVEIDNFEAGYRLGRHVAERRPGATVAYFTADASAHTASLRRLGIQCAAADAGGKVAAFSCDAGDAAAVRRALRRLRPAAIVCANDELAFELAGTLRALGRRIPEDILLAGFDDVPAAAAMTPPLTTVRQPWRLLARVAYETLLRRIAAPDAIPRRVVLSAPLVVRASTGGAAAEDSLSPARCRSRQNTNGKPKETP